MNKDESDFFRYIKKDPNPGNNAALNLINGLENRVFGEIKKNVRTRDNIEIYAEEQFIRKADFDEMRCEMPGLPRSTFLMVFSPDGSRVASTHGNHNIYITDIRTGKHIRTLVGHPRTPWCIAFHPTSDQIVASGCLGGQVRIWDLSGGSEVWTAENQTVIASLAFHPTDRVLVIATYNELYFWDWSQPEPFVHVATSNPKERVRFVAFDSLGHKLITGIANGPQTSWGRVRAPVPVSRQERSVSPYRRRITQRLVNSIQFNQPSPNNPPHAQETPNTAESLSNVPERVRRITVCYRNLVREYEQLVQRYLQLYRPPTMIDRGTDPMEPFPEVQQRGNNTENPGPSTSNSQAESEAGPQPGCSKQDDQRPSTSCGTQTSKATTDALPSQSAERFPLVAPSRIFSVINKPSVLIRGTQTSESRKHKAEPNQTEPKGKRLKKSSTQDDEGASRDSVETPGPSSSPCSQPQNDPDSQPSSARKFVVINLKKLNKTPSSSSSPTCSTPSSEPSTSGFRIRIPLDNRDTTNANDDNNTNNTNNMDTNTRDNLQLNSDSRDNLSEENNYSSSNVDELLHNIRRTAEEEVRNRILPIIRSVPANDRPELIRLFENSREHVRRRFRQMYPAFIKKQNSRRNVNIVDTTSESSTSDEDNSNPPTVCPTRRNSAGSLNNQNTTASTTNTSSPNVASSSSSTVRNFNTELEQLVTSLLTEIERNETEGTTSNSNTNVNTQTARNDSLEGNTAPPEIPTSVREEPSSLAPSALAPSSSTQTDMSLPPHSPPSPRFFQYYLHRPRPSDENISRENSTPTGLNVNTNPIQPNSLNYVPRRRRFSLHRMSAFMPTRVHYQRLPSRIRRPTHTLGRGRLGLRSQGPVPFENDELINFSEREHSEEESPSQPLDLSNHTPAETGSTGNMYSNIRLGSVYSNIIHDLENSLSDVIRMRTSNRPGETSDMLGSFSERLENIMQQSDMILRNLSNSVEMLSNSTEPNTLRPQGSEPSWSFFDQNFYVRDQRTETTSQETSREDTINLSDIFNSRPPFNSATSDHTYPRNPENADASSQSESITPLMTSIHMTISHIQRQARLLRRQVEIIERIDRAMLEVAQLQLIRQLIIELVRHMRTVTGERRSTGVSSVRQMMAGTRISDSSPYESPAEDAPPQPSVQSSASSSTSNTGEQSTSSGTQTRPPRSSNRKTYPPGRLLRRRSSIVNFFSRRYNRSERNARSTLVDRNVRNPFTPRATYEPYNNYSYVNPNTLAYMTRRLQHLLIEQVRMLTPATAPSDLPHIIGRRTAVAVGEHMLVSRLHGCVLRVNRLTGHNALPNPQENLRRDPSAAVTPDGESRYRARHTLSMIIECISRHIEELGYPSIAPSMRQQLHGVCVMSLLLTELLLLVIVDSIPPPTGINLIPERASLTSRIDHMVNQLLQSRFSHSHQLTRSLRLMKLTMRHAQSALDETYRNRRNEMLPRVNTNRRQVLGSINRCLRFINRQREASNTEQQNMPSTSNTAEPEPSSSSNPNPAEEEEEDDEDTIPESNDHNGEWYSNIYDFFLRRYTNNRDDDADNQPSTSNRDRIQQNDVSSTNDNTDGEDDETDGYNNNYIPRTSNSYRTNNVNVGLHVNVGGGSGSGPPPRPWNVPAVQVNDVPVFEATSTIAQRIITQRQRFAERVSELRSNPTMGLFRPRFLHPLYASVMNPFDADLDDPQREPLYDSDMITTVTPNHRIQAWDVSDWTLPVPEISDALKNVVVGECKIHNDASVDVAKDGTILVTLLPSGGYLNVTNRLGVYSLKWETLGQCLYTASFEQNAVSVSLSPLSRHLVVGLTHRIITSDRWVMARVFRIDQKDVPGDRLPVIRELEQSRDSRINCIRWLPTSGQGLIYATNTGQLVVLS